MRQLSALQNYLFMAGALLVLAGAATFVVWPRVALVLYAVGALSFAAMQLQQTYDGHSYVLRRLRRQQLLGAAAIVLTAGFMAMQALDFGFARHGEWVVCLTVGCVLELYTAFRIPAELEREQRRVSNPAT